MSWFAGVLLFILLALLGFIALVLGEYVLRENRIHKVRILGREEHFDPADPLFIETFQLLTNSTMYDGNAVEILLNGDETYPRMLEDLRNAKSLITWHVFWFKPGKLADQVREVLMERARAGVKVFFLFDAIGSRGLDKSYGKDLESAGVEVDVFRPLRWRLLYKVQERMHIRCVVIDGRVGYTGGFGIDDHWLGDGRHQDQWRDTNVRLVGPAVDQLQASFVTNWGESTGAILTGDIFFHPEDEPVGDVSAGLIHTAPSLGSTNAERYFVLAISAARRRLWITNPYFLPDDDFQQLLCAAVDRGVDVRVLTPGVHNDRKSVFWASRSHYEKLLRAGVRIWEYEPGMIHAKTLVVDGVLFSVGTINFDNRSVMLNDEVTLTGHDERISRRFEEVFLQDLEHAREVDLETFRSRAWTQKVRERAWRTVQAVL